jgi:hypothetical protein
VLAAWRMKQAKPCLDGRPLAAMVETSFTNTGTGVPPDQVTHHYNNDNNFALDQISVFLAGGIGEHTGGFVQATYSDVPNASNLDNADLRPYTTTFDLFGKELRVGTTFGPKSNFNQVQLNASYWYTNTYGVTIAWQNIWGRPTHLFIRPGPT